MSRPAYDNELLAAMKEEEKFVRDNERGERRVKVEKGQVWKVRFLPVHLGERGTWFARIAKHWHNKKPVTCPIYTGVDWGGDPEAECPVCRASDELNTSPDEAISKFGYSVRASSQWLTFCIVLEKDGTEIMGNELLMPYEFWHYVSTWEALKGFWKARLLNACTIPSIHQYVESVSEMEGSSLYNPLRAGKNITGARILIERLRERGIGDLLFLTGPLAFFNHVTGANIINHLYAYSDRGVVLTHSPFLHNGTVLCGPVEYDCLRNYNYHWLVGSVTECDEEADQLNVYDALYTQLGFDPKEIDPQFKRPSVTLVNQDYQSLDTLFQGIWQHRKLDLRRIPYYVVAPFSNASLRSLNYTTWLHVIRELATRRPVVVVGLTHWKLPDTDISAGQFIEQFSSMGQAVISAMDATPLRTMMALIARSSGCFCVDSGPLYIAQALNIPAVSVWGTHDPGLRIGYDKGLMDLAVWNDTACNEAPCCAYSEFPAHKCPEGPNQRVCACLDAVTPDDILKKVDQMEERRLVKA